MSARWWLASVLTVFLGRPAGTASDTGPDPARSEVKPVAVGATESTVGDTASPRPTLADGKVVTGVIPCGATLDDRLPDGVARKISEALPMAIEHLRDHSACQELFTRLGADALTTFDRSVYAPMPEGRERQYCSGGRSYAVTTVGGNIVLPCRSFAHLSGREAAIILIHEALHNAGQTEYPSDPEAPDSEGITAVVMRSCGLY